MSKCKTCCGTGYIASDDDQAMPDSQDKCPDCNQE